MGYKTVFAVATDPDRAASLANAAAVLARAQDAHLDLLALGIDRTQIGYTYAATGVLLQQAAMERAEEDSRAVEAALRAALAGQADGLRWTVEPAVAQLGSLADLVALRARYADLAVSARPYGQGRGVEDEVIVEAALFDAHVPVIVLPEVPLAGPVGRNVVLAWNRSAEAMRAVRLALPLLKAADSVSIAVVDPPSVGPERSDPGGMLCQMLVRHGVKAEVAVLAKTRPRVSDVLAQHIRDRGADLMVMGAYGHSRFRESILGGATRDMLESAEVPVFMAR